MGFPVPFNHWLKGPIRDFVCDTLLGRAARERGMYRTDEIERRILKTGKFSRLLWGILCLELWHQQFIDAPATQVLDSTPAASVPPTRPIRIPPPKRIPYPSGCPLAFDWIGDCGIATGATPQVNCAFGTNDITLRVTNNGASLSSPANVQITVTDYAVAVSPATATVSGGQAALYTVALDPQFGSFNNSVSLTCSNLPLSASCNFSPTVLTPGSMPRSAAHRAA